MNQAFSLSLGDSFRKKLLSRVEKLLSDQLKTIALVNVY